jgi:photosynthetic reaction center cytochrome c subunit
VIWTALAVLALVAVVIVPEWHWPVAGHELGWRASSMVQFDPTPLPAERSAEPPAPLPPWPADARPAASAYKNIQVLTDLNAGQVLRLMTAMTQWVSPKQGCGFCHAGGDYASEANPLKQTARMMLKMTRHINAAWRTHVGTSGVTCFSCHQGQPAPSEMWFAAPPKTQRPMIDWQEDYHEDAKMVRTFFPYEGFEEYLLQDTSGSSQSYTALPTKSVQSQIVIKRLYEVMMQMSDGIGVNCDYCHNSRAFFDWSQSTPARWTGFSGIQMTRDLNKNFILPAGLMLPQGRFRLAKAGELNVPPEEAGWQAGNGLANCATCHHFEPKPLGGADLISAYPGLAGPDPGSPSTAAQIQGAALVTKGAPGAKPAPLTP